MKVADKKWHRCCECGWERYRRDIVVITDPSGRDMPCCIDCLARISATVEKHKEAKKQDVPWEEV